MARFRVTYEIEANGFTTYAPDWKQADTAEGMRPLIPASAEIEEIVDRSGWYGNKGDENSDGEIQAVYYWTEKEIRSYGVDEFFEGRIAYDVKPRET